MSQGPSGGSEVGSFASRLPSDSCANIYSASETLNHGPHTALTGRLPRRQWFSKVAGALRYTAPYLSSSPCIHTSTSVYWRMQLSLLRPRGRFYLPWRRSLFAFIHSSLCPYECVGVCVNEYCVTYFIFVCLYFIVSLVLFF